MVLVDIKPLAKQTGIGVFKSYYTYFYQNGMVAIDKLGGYGALYVMPVHIYREARYKKNLSEKDIRDAEVTASIDFPYTLEEMENLQKSLENAGQFSEKIKDEAEKRKQRIQLLIDIDNELTSNVEEFSELSKEEFELEIDKLNEEELLTFDELYTFWKQNHGNKRYKRNPVVAEFTKNRARDEDGNYCCELCGTKNFEHSSFDSHHVIPLSSGGVDNIYNTVCLCPNCHRYVHSGKMTLNQQHYLFEIIKEHIVRDNLEYIVKFNKMISPIAESEEYYQKHKE